MQTECKYHCDLEPASVVPHWNGVLKIINRAFHFKIVFQARISYFNNETLVPVIVEDFGFKRALPLAATYISWIALSVIQFICCKTIFFLKMSRAERNITLSDRWDEIVGPLTVCAPHPSANV